MFVNIASKMDTVGSGLFVVTLLCLGSISHADFTVMPRNTVIQEGLEVSLNCEAEGANHDILWSEASAPGGAYTNIGFNDNVYETYRGRYTLDYEPSTPTTTSRSVLTITGVLPEDAGTFRCQDVPASLNVYSQLILLDGQPQVEANATMDDIVEGEFFALSCHVGYTASISWRPTMTWREATDGVLPARDESNENEARYVYATETTRDHNGKRYQCSAEFGAIPEGDIPESIRDQHDMAPPDYSFSSPMTDLIVNFPVENLVLENPKDIYRPGESLTFSAVARPGPSYYWQNLITNDTVSENILNVTPEMEGTQNWTYVAYNEIRGERFEISRNHHFIVEIPTTTTTTTTPAPPPSQSSTTDEGGPDPTEPSVGSLITSAQDGEKSVLSGGAIAGIVIGCLVGLALIILLIFCCISRNKAPKTAKEKSGKANHVDAIRNQPQMVMPPGDIAYIDKEKGPPPYNPYAPPSIKTDEGLVYADLAFEDKPRSRKPIQVYENTEYGDIV